MSGSPVWLIRDSEQPTEPITIERLVSRSGKPYRMAAQLVGVTVKYFQDSGEVSAVKADICAKFVEQAIEVLPSLHSPEEDAWIDDQLQLS